MLRGCKRRKREERKKRKENDVGGGCGVHCIALYCTVKLVSLPCGANFDGIFNNNCISEMVL